MKPPLLNLIPAALASLILWELLARSIEISFSITLPFKSEDYLLMWGTSQGLFLLLSWSIYGRIFSSISFMWLGLYLIRGFLDQQWTVLLFSFLFLISCFLLTYRVSSYPSEWLWVIKIIIISIYICTFLLFTYFILNYFPISACSGQLFYTISDYWKNYLQVFGRSGVDSYTLRFLFAFFLSVSENWKLVTSGVVCYVLVRGLVSLLVKKWMKKKKIC